MIDLSMHALTRPIRPAEEFQDVRFVRQAIKNRWPYISQGRGDIQVPATL
jgi:hypothetical protein